MRTINFIVEREIAKIRTMLVAAMLIRVEQNEEALHAIEASERMRPVNKNSRLRKDNKPARPQHKHQLAFELMKAEA